METINKYIFLVIILFLVIGIAYYYIPYKESLKNNPVTTNLEIMIKEYDYIVLSSYTSFDTSWNMFRNPDSIDKDHLYNYVECRLYNFKVDNVLKGFVIDDDIKINHRYLENVDYIYNDEVMEKRL